MNSRGIKSFLTPDTRGITFSSGTLEKGLDLDTIMPGKPYSRSDWRARINVNITCPSCGTRYRQPATAELSSVSCSCSRCEAVFPSDARTPRYSISRSGCTEPDAGPVSIDTVLAIGARLEPEAPAVTPPLVLPVPGLADLPIVMDDPALASKIRGKGFAAPVEAAPLTDSGVAVEEPEAEAEEPAKSKASVPERHRPPRDTRPGFGAFMMVACLPTAMAAGAWQLSTMFAEDPLIWTTPAGVLGLLFSWLWVRWKYRER